MVMMEIARCGSISTNNIPDDYYEDEMIFQLNRLEKVGLVISEEIPAEDKSYQKYSMTERGRNWLCFL